jgi:hypothetical protein
MRYLKIENNGILDIRLVALMGGTTKSNQEFKIGHFGSGLKYSLAFFFRHNLDFKIFAGTEEIKISLDTEIIREENFDIICINGHRTSITTKMGEDWKAWMVIRELWSNALDEGGESKYVTSKIEATEGKTTFYIQVDQQIQEVLDHWTKYFIHGIEPMSSTQQYDIYPGGPTLRIYKNGVLIQESDKTKSLFSYDIKNASLNELREFKGSTGYEVTHAIFGANEKVADYFLQHIQDDHYEGGDLSYDWYTDSWGEPWKKALGSAKLIHQKALESIRQSGVQIPDDKYVIVPKSVFASMTKQFEHVSALRIASKVGEFFEDHSQEAESKIKQGLVILEACGYHIHPELTFVFGYFGDKKVQARVSLDEKKVYISNTLVQASLHAIVATLLEENEHFTTGMQDCSREFQQHFINLYARELLAKNKIEI